MLYGGDVITSCATAAGMQRSSSSVSPPCRETVALASHPAAIRRRGLPSPSLIPTGPSLYPDGGRERSGSGRGWIDAPPAHGDTPRRVRRRRDHMSTARVGDVELYYEEH